MQKPGSRTAALLGIDVRGVGADELALHHRRDHPGPRPDRAAD